MLMHVILLSLSFIVTPENDYVDREFTWGVRTGVNERLVESVVMLVVTLLLL